MGSIKLSFLKRVTNMNINKIKFSDQRSVNVPHMTLKTYVISYYCYLQNFDDVIFFVTVTLMNSFRLDF